MPVTITNITLKPPTASAASSALTIASEITNNLLKTLGIGVKPPVRAPVPNNNFLPSTAVPLPAVGSLNNALSNVLSTSKPPPTVNIGGISIPTPASILDAVQASIEQSLIKSKFQSLIDRGIKNIAQKPFQTEEGTLQIYAKDTPEILFVSEYIVNNKFCGVLVVWKQYSSSTHYEVYKKSIFQETAVFNRILFLDTQSLDEEKSYFVDYIQNTLGFSSLDVDNIYVILDDDLVEDRIYEYAISGVRVPTVVSDIFYDLIMINKDLINPVEFSDSATIFDFAGINLGSTDLAWIVSLLNQELVFFGRTGVEKTISSFFNNPNVKIKTLNIPKDLNDVMDIYQQSVNVFSLLDVLSNIIDQLGGLTPSFKTSFMNAVDTQKNAFSYDKFRQEIFDQVPVFKLLLTVAQSKITTAISQLSALSIVVPLDSGTERLSSVESLTKVFKFVNNILLSVLYAQEQSNISKVSGIVAQVVADSSTSAQNSFNQAIGQLPFSVTVAPAAPSATTTTGGGSVTSNPLIRVI